MTHVIELHELFAVQLLALVQRNELDLLRWKCFVCEGTLDCFLVSAVLN